LRNRIYELALADNGPKECYLIYDSSGILKRPLYGSTRHHGLTQVNKLLRAEFLPLYTEAMKVTIHPRHLDEYLKTFPLKDRACSEYIRSFLASVPEKLHELPTKPHSSGIDILPFLGLVWASFPLDFRVYMSGRAVNSSSPIKFLTYLTFDSESQELLKDLLNDKVFSSITMSRESTRSQDILIELTLNADLHVQATDVLKAKMNMVRQFQRACQQTRMVGVVVECNCGGVIMSLRTARPLPDMFW
jgi:hypothetical protein